MVGIFSTGESNMWSVSLKLTNMEIVKDLMQIFGLIEAMDHLTLCFVTGVC